MWLVMALAITAGSVLVLRGEPGWRPAWALAVTALAASTVPATAPDRRRLASIKHCAGAFWGWCLYDFLCPGMAKTIKRPRSLSPRLHIR